MKKIILDVSVFLKVIAEEEGSDIARSLLLKAAEEGWGISVPSLFKYEVLKTSLILGVNLKNAFELLTSFLEADTKIEDVNFKILELTNKIVSSGNVKSGFPSFYDAIYHAIAISNNATFITADKKYFAKVRQFGNILLLGEA